MSSAAKAIDWIEEALYDDWNFREIPEILAEARALFVRKSPDMETDS